MATALSATKTNAQKISIPREDLCGLALFVQGKREQEPLDGDIAVTGLVGDLLRLIEDARQCRGQIDLACSAARHFRKARECRLYPRNGVA